MDDDLSGETADPMPPPSPPFDGLEFVCKRSEGPWRMLGFHEQWVFWFAIHPLPYSLTTYVSVAASISTATPLHHNLELNGATPRTGKPLFLVTSPICVLREEWGVGRRKKSRLPWQTTCVTGLNLPYFAKPYPSLVPLPCSMVGR